MIKHIAFWSGLIGTSLFVLTSIVGGLQFEGYSFISQYISESYATGVPNATYLRKLFISSGALLTLFGFFAPYALRTSKSIKINFFLFAVFYGIGTVVTSIFPCDFGCPSEGEVSLSQMIHNSSGFLTYVIVPFCLIVIGVASKKLEYPKLSKISLFCGILALSFVVILFGNPKGQFIGLFQRIIEACILFWVVYFPFFIRRKYNSASKKW